MLGYERAIQTKEEPSSSKSSLARKGERNGGEKKNSVHLGRNVYFQKAPPASSPLSFKDPWLARAERVAAVPPRRLPVKRQCLLFLKETGSMRPLPATTVFLKCNLCLSFCRVFFLLFPISPPSVFYIGEYSNRMCHYAFCVE